MFDVSKFMNKIKKYKHSYHIVWSIKPLLCVKVIGILLISKCGEVQTISSHRYRWYSFSRRLPTRLLKPVQLINPRSSPGCQPQLRTRATKRKRQRHKDIGMATTVRETKQKTDLLSRTTSFHDSKSRFY
jgi:hypothetical protein